MNQHLERLKVLIPRAQVREGFTHQDALDMLAKLVYILDIDDETPPPAANANAIVQFRPTGQSIFG